MLDDLDRRLLRLWQDEPSLAPAELAERARITVSKATRRLAKMQESGVIEGVGSIIDWTALGYAVEVSLRVTLDKTVSRSFEAFIEAARKVPEVTQIQTFLGRVDVRLNIVARDMPHYHDIYRDHILSLPHIADIEALMHIARIKSEESLPL
ncbi:MAG: Lrp/AsnC family transcriptional regulator [Roseobacter sp.]|uniref:Lrp/AsnC family transcriptional regulator n=1 Tax=Parasphingorhabdus sp. TaxID=2709688 RepID=UPI003297B0CF